VGGLDTGTTLTRGEGVDLVETIWERVGAADTIADTGDWASSLSGSWCGSWLCEDVL